MGQQKKENAEAEEINAGNRIPTYGGVGTPSRQKHIAANRSVHKDEKPPVEEPPGDLANTSNDKDQNATKPIAENATEDTEDDEDDEDDIEAAPSNASNASGKVSAGAEDDIEDDIENQNSFPNSSSGAAGNASKDKDDEDKSSFPN